MRRGAERVCATHGHKEPTHTSDPAAEGPGRAHHGRFSLDWNRTGSENADPDHN